ncbi:unnamed protein product, partial [Rotaria magnacalcarata]
MDRYIKEFRQVVDESSAWRRETEQALDTSTASGIFESLPEIDDRTKKIELALDTSWNNWWSGDEGGSQAGCGEQTWGDSAGRGKVCREQHGGLQRTTDCERETHYGFRRRVCGCTVAPKVPWHQKEEITRDHQSPARKDWKRS